MNKQLVKLLALMLAAVAFLVPALTSCEVGKATAKLTEEQLLAMGERDRAMKLLEVGSEAMEGWDSYTEKNTMTMNLTIEGIEISMKMEGTDKVQGRKKSTMMRSSVQASTMTVAGEAMQTLEKKGYQDGKMYLYKSEDGVKKVALQSPITAKEYREFLSTDNSSDTDDMLMEDMKNCSVATIRKSDGGWTVKLFGFGQSILDEMLLKTGMGAFEEGLSMENLALKVDLTPSYTFEKMTVSADIVYGNVKTTFSVVSEYKGIESTTVSPVDLTGYMQVHDLRVPFQFADELDRYCYEDEGSFQVKVDANVSMYGQTENVQAVYDVTYGFQNGKYSYEMDAREDTETYQIKYANGTKKTYLIEGAYTQLVSNKPSTDAQQIASINELINYTFFSVYNVKNVTAGSKPGTFVITVEVDDTFKESYAADSSFECQSSTGVITAKFTDGKLTSYEFDLDLTYRMKAGNYTYTVASTAPVTFN
ncbi:MAG: hypothetical protein J6V82_04370 [Clostridia bacterium]|nr:hypothetical protein [Clostridia bacterium]